MTIPTTPGTVSPARPAAAPAISRARSFTVGIGGPVGSGKTALLLALCQQLRDRYQLGVVTNDIFTKEDAEFLMRHEALPRRAHSGGRNRRMSAHGDSRRHQPKPGRARDVDGIAASRSCCSWKAAATTWPRSSAATWPTTRSTSSTCPAATRFRGRAVRASRSPTLLIINKTDLGAVGRRRSRRDGSRRTERCAATVRSSLRR